MKYHINNKGVPAICHASVRACPYGGEESHYNSLDEAQAAADEANAKTYGTIPIKRSYTELALESAIFANNKELTDEDLHEVHKIFEGVPHSKDLIDTTLAQVAATQNKTTDLGLLRAANGTEGYETIYSIMRHKKLSDEAIIYANTHYPMSLHKVLAFADSNTCERAYKLTGQVNGLNNNLSEELLIEVVNNEDLSGDSSTAKSFSYEVKEIDTMTHSTKVTPHERIALHPSATDRVHKALEENHK